MGNVKLYCACVISPTVEIMENTYSPVLEEARVLQSVQLKTSEKAKVRAYIFAYPEGWDKNMAVN